MALGDWLKEKLFRIKDGPFEHMSKISFQKEEKEGYDWKDRELDKLFEGFISSVESDTRRVLGLSKPEGAESSITFKERVEIREMFDKLTLKSAYNQMKILDETAKDIFAAVDTSKMSREEKKQFDALKKDFEGLGRDISKVSLKDMEGSSRDLILEKLEKYTEVIDKLADGGGKFVSKEAEKELAKRMEDRESAHNKMIEKETRELAGEVVKRMDGSRYKGKEIDGEAEMQELLKGSGITDKLNKAGFIIKDADGHEGHGAGEQRESEKSRGNGR